MIITVSDINGIKQYDVPNSIKKIIISLLLAITVLIVGLIYYANTLYTKVAVLEKNINIKRIVEKEKQKSKLVFNQNSMTTVKFNNTLKRARLLKLEEVKKLEKLVKIEKAKKAQLAKLEKAKREKLAKEKAKKEALSKAQKAKKEKLVKLEKAKREKLAKEKAKKEALAKTKKAKKEKLAKLEKAKRKKLEKIKAKKIALVKNKKTKKIRLLPKIAKTKLGRRYVWGAIGPGTFDCSGFTSYVYRKTGIFIPRTSRQQSIYGKLVDRKHLKPGDLIFFDTSRRSRGIINHVGMYIGNNKFIHASSAKKRVVITSLSKNFYSKRFKWARRVVN
jgi:cell wall-associated NlpC family hydrolase